MIWIVAPHFVAAVIPGVRSAPILRYMVPQQLSTALGYGVAATYFRWKGR